MTLRSLICTKLATGVALAVFATGPCWAQDGAKVPASIATKTPGANATERAGALAMPKIPASRPAWSELSPTQKQALEPLAAQWQTSMSDQQRRKWIEISTNYQNLSPEGQATLHSRMNEWVALSPQQRAQARLNFAKTEELSREMTPAQKQEKWQAYQALSAEEKAKLAAKAPRRPTGAATAIKPVAPQKLAVVRADSGDKPKIVRPVPKVSTVQDD